MGFIKKLISGIIGFLTGLFKGVKKSEYFLELDDAEAAKSSAAPAKVEPPKTEVPKAEPAKSEPAKSGSTNGKVPEAATAVAASTPVEIASPPSESAPAPQPSPVLTKPESSPTFATDFLLTPASSSRRRPGPSLNYFRDMAKQVKS